METELPFDRNQEFLRPLVSSWLLRLNQAEKSRSKWSEVADECMMFYSRSAAAMWDNEYSRKFWRGVKAPKFRLTLNKAFEYVAIVGPNLMWDVPHRMVKPRKKLVVTPDLLPSQPGSEEFLEYLLQAQQQAEQSNAVVAMLLEAWLNYTPREQPGGGLFMQSWLSLLDALIKGRGVMAVRPYVMPESDRRLTGSFRIRPEDVLFDPDARTVHDAKWAAIRHIEPYWEVERRFRWPSNSLRNRATLESRWHETDVATRLDKHLGKRAAGLSKDMIVWWEVYSRSGLGIRSGGMDDRIRGYLDSLVGDFVYLAVAENVPSPLNCPKNAVVAGMTSEEVRNRFRWPIPMYKDDRWTFEVLDFYPDPDSVWPLPPLAPALGELKFLNFIIPWLANRIWSSSRDFWSVLGPHVDHYLKYLQEGQDQTVIPTPAMVDDVRKAIQVIQQPETRLDVWKIVELVSDLFDKRVGLPEVAYGRNEGGTQDRAAEVTRARQRALGVRPGYMQRLVVEFQTRLESAEAIVSRMFIRGSDVLPLLGPVGQYLWDQHVSGAEDDAVVREMQYTVAASSIRPPDREAETANFQTLMQSFFPLAQQAYQNGDPRPANYLLSKFGELYDIDVEGAMLSPPQKMQPGGPDAETPEGAGQANPEAEIERSRLEEKAAVEVEKDRLDLQKRQMEFEFDVMRSRQELEHAEQRHQMDMQQRAQRLAMAFPGSNGRR